MDADGSPLRTRIERVIDERLTGRPGWVVLVELFLGFGWLRAAIAKIMSSDWWGGDPIREFAATHADQTLPYYRPVIQHVISPAIVAVAIATVGLQLTIAATILSGRKIVYGLLVATALNINIIVAGGVDPSIFYLIMQAALLIWLVESGRTGRHPAKHLSWGLFGGTLVFLTALPFINSLKPEDVIEDPGAVLATYGFCVAIACLTGLRAARNGELATGT